MTDHRSSDGGASRRDRGQPKRPTIRDVAAHAGVSHQTVSRVINGHASVSPATAERVRVAIGELEYVPSPIARGLSSNRTHSIGMVTSDISDGFFARAVAGAEAEARRRGYYLIIGSVEASDVDDDGQGYLRLMLERRVEGLILARPSVPVSDEQLGPARRAGIPVVAMCLPELPSFTTVDVDNRRGGFDAASYLIEQGHRRVATIVGPVDYPSALARLEGYRDALREAEIPEDPALRETAQDWGLESGQAATARLLARRVPFTALFAHSDLIALGAIRQLQLAGLRVPEDVSVIGFDDLPVAAFVDPPLTTIHQPMAEVGALAVSVMLDQLSGAEPDRNSHLLPTSLVVRKSVAPARS
jgi:DNA-binding LacI/PurR family transcriptional regulator